MAEKVGESEPDWKRTVEEYKVVTHHGSSILHRLRGSCSKDLSTRDGECSFQATFRKAEPEGDDGGQIRYIDRCGTHVPDEWVEVANGEREADYDVVYLRQTCGKMVEKVVTTDREIEAIPLGEEEPETVEVPEHIRGERETVGECGTRGFVTFITEDGQRKTFCKRHARDTWLSGLRHE